MGDARVVGYDNECGKGDHKHLREAEMDYTFSRVEALLADFWRDAAALSEWLAVKRDDNGNVLVPWDEIDFKLPLTRRVA